MNCTNLRTVRSVTCCALSPAHWDPVSFLRWAAFAEAPVHQGQRTLQVLGFAADTRLRKKLWRGKQPPLHFPCETLVDGCRRRSHSRFGRRGSRGVR